MSRQDGFSGYCSEESCRKRLEHFLKNQKKGVAHFYRNDQDPGTFNLDDASARASRLVRSVVEDKLLGNDPQIKELAKDLAVLALYDMAILIDDSGSMVDEERGERVKILKGVLSIINDIYHHAAEPGIGIKAIRFMNNDGDKDEFSGNPYELIEDHYFGGTTKIGTELHKRILKKLVLETSMKKPLLVMVITDGAIEGEKRGLLEKVIISCVKKLEKDRKDGADSVAFQFSCIGNDEGARKVLEELDDHQLVGKYVDCQKASQVLDLSEERHLTVTKLLLGAIIEAYDDEDHGLSDDLDLDDDLEVEHGRSTGGLGSPGTRPSNTGGNPGDSSNGNNSYNIHIPQGLGQHQSQSVQHPYGQGGEYRVAPEGQFPSNYQTAPHYQPSPPAPYLPGNSLNFPYQPEVNPNFGIFGPDHSQPLPQENSSGYPPGNPSPSQGPYPGQAYPGLAEAQRAQMDGQNETREALEQARRAVEEGRRMAEEDIRASFPGLHEGVRPTKTQEQLEEEEELRQEREEEESEARHELEENNSDLD